MAQTHRLQIYLEPWVYEQLRKESYKCKKSLTALIRETLSRRFEKRPEGGAFTLLKVSGALHDHDTDVSERHDDYLWSED